MTPTVGYVIKHIIINKMFYVFNNITTSIFWSDIRSAYENKLHWTM